MKLLHVALAALTLLLPTTLPVCALGGLADKDLGSPDADVAPIAGGMVQIFVQDAASARLLSGVKIEITALGPIDPVWYGMTDRGGRFEQALPAGRYRAKVSCGRAYEVRDFRIVDGELKTLKFALKPGPRVLLTHAIDLTTT